MKKAWLRGVSEEAGALGILVRQEDEAMMRRTSPWVAGLLLVGFVSLARGAVTTTTVSYGATITDNHGVARAVSFQGTANGPNLVGTVTVDSDAMTVTGTIAKDGSISGHFASADGKRLGAFWGQRAGAEIKGSFDLGGKVGDWSVPVSRLPIPK